MSNPTIHVAVVMQRVAAPNPWEAWRWQVLEVVPDEGVFGHRPRKLVDDGTLSRWLHPGFSLSLYPDECKGYFLNLTSGRPAWFVAWQVNESDPSLAEVNAVSVSYIEADRRLTAEEKVEALPLDDALCEWLREFTNAHFRPDTGRRVRAQSFLSPEERARQGPPLDMSELKQMFHSDPHFQQGDGLDVQAQDVVDVASSPLARQRQIQKARALGLLDDELLEQDKPGPAAGPARTDTHPPDEDADLQLQPHHAAGRPRPEPGPDGRGA